MRSLALLCCRRLFTMWGRMPSCSGLVVRRQLRQARGGLTIRRSLTSCPTVFRALYAAVVSAIFVVLLPLAAQQAPASSNQSAPAQGAPAPAQAGPAANQAAPAANQSAPAANQAAPGANQATPAATQATPAAPAAAPSPAPSTENWLTGSIDLGYRWLIGVGGSTATYRTFVDLGSGPKLLAADFTLTDPKHRAFDSLRVRAYSWGDEPYESLYVNAKKSNLYDFSVDYRNIAYYDFLPSYADPLLARGITLNEQAFDTRRRIANFRLDLRPGARIVPYFAFDRDYGSGPGTTAYGNGATNSFPVPTNMRDLTYLYSGGLRFELRRFHVTLEQGGTTFNSNQTLFQSPGSVNYGNVSTPVLGQTTFLTSLLAAYGISGHSVYSKGLFTANATSWLDLYGQFLYSQPDTNVHYQDSTTGNFLLQSQVLFYTSQAFLVSAAAKLPHTTGSLGGEIRPFRRVRLVETWLTDRLHNGGSAFSNQTIVAPALAPNSSQQIAAALTASLANNYNQEEIDIYFDATAKLLLRGGYRYVWGNITDAVLPPEGLASSDAAKLRTNVGMGGLNYRPIQKLSLTAEAEAASSGANYYRISLYDYEKVRSQAHYQLFKSLNVAGDFWALINNNPTPGVNYSYRAQQESLSLLWAPGGLFDMQGSYTRATVYSDINFLAPQTLSPQLSLYRDDAHIVTALMNLRLSRKKDFVPRISAGGSMFISSGSRPTTYYQPIATFWLPLAKPVSWFAEWRYYGYGEIFYLYEGFRSQLVTTGLRFTR
jgi:hypothetical protein